MEAIKQFFKDTKLHTLPCASRAAGQTGCKSSSRSWPSVVPSSLARTARRSRNCSQRRKVGARATCGSRPYILHSSGRRGWSSHSDAARSAAATDCYTYRPTSGHSGASSASAGSAVQRVGDSKDSQGTGRHPLRHEGAVEGSNKKPRTAFQPATFDPKWHRRLLVAFADEQQGNYLVDLQQPTDTLPRMRDMLGLPRARDHRQEKHFANSEGGERDAGVRARMGRSTGL